MGHEQEPLFFWLVCFAWSREGIRDGCTSKWKENELGASFGQLIEWAE